MSYDKLSTRLVQILMRFNNNERFTLQELAQEFNVDIRTIQRDLNERLAFMPIKKENGKYFLESYALGKLSFKDIKNFATLSGISQLYPKLDKEFINDLLNNKVNAAFLVKSNGFETIPYELFETISLAILKQSLITLTYKDKQRILKPYKLIHNDGIWYLLADEEGLLKHFTLSKILNLKVLKESFRADKKILKAIEEENSKWFGEKNQALLEVKQEAKTYFLRKSIFNHCEIIEENQDFFAVKVDFSYDDEILNIIKQWIPYIKIKSPQNLKDKLEKILKAYLNPKA